jgi:hypothetical protein
MAADLNLTLNGTPVPVYLGENATLALAQAIRAEAAADAAAASEAVALAAAGPNYADTAAGLAATSEGDTFAVEDDGIVTIYRHDSGPTATELRVLPTTAALASTDPGKGDAMIGHRSIVKATAFLTTTSDLLNGAPVNVFANIPRAQHAAILDGSSTYDAQSDIQELIDACGTTGATLTFPPCGTVWIGGKLSITNKNSITFQGTGCRYMAGAALRMLPSSTDDCMWELSQSNDIVWRNLGMFGRSPTEASTYLIKADDDNGDLDLSVIDCHLGNMRTLAYLKGRGFLLQGSSVVNVTNGLEIDWPADEDFVPLGNTNHYIGSAMRAYRVFDNRFHSWSSGFLIINTGEKAHYIRPVQIIDNYADTNMRVWNGHMRGARIIGNTIIDTAGTTTPLFDIPADLNSFGGVINEDNLIAFNYFGGQYDTTYESGGNPSVRDTPFLSVGTFRNTSGNKFIGNVFNRFARDGIEFTGTCNALTIRDNTFREACLDAMQTLTITGTTGVFQAGETITGGTSGATAMLVYSGVSTLRLVSVSGTFQTSETITGGTSGATATVSTSTAPAARWPIDLSGVTSGADIEIDGIHVVGDSNPGGSRPVINVSGATLSDLRIGDIFFDTAKWIRDNYIPVEHTTIADDAVFTARLRNGAGTITLQAVDGAATMHSCVVTYKLQGANSAAILSYTSDIFTVDVSDTIPTGTSGTDGKFNLYFVESSGVKTLYVENRHGGARAMAVIQ